MQAWKQNDVVYVVLEAMRLGSLLDVMRNAGNPLFFDRGCACCEDRNQNKAIRHQHDNDNVKRNDNDKHNDKGQRVYNDNGKQYNNNDNGIHDANNERVMLAISFQLLWGLK